MATIVFDGRNLLLNRGTGIKTYTRHLIEAARALDHRAELLVATNQRVPAEAEIDLQTLLNAIEGERSRDVRMKVAAHFLFGAPFSQKLASMGIDASNVQLPATLRPFDKIHAGTALFDTANYQLNRLGQPLTVRLDSNASLFHATHATPLRIASMANIYTIHDIVPLRAPTLTLDNKKIFRATVTSLCRTADHIVTVSEFSRRDIIALTGIEENRITNTYQSVELPAEFLTSSEDALSQELEQFFGLELGKYFLFVGAIEPKKNLTRLIEAYAASGSRTPLVLVVDLGWQYDEIVKAINDERFLTYAIKGDEITPRRRVRRLGFVPLGRLVSLYRGARAFLFPSVYEGFGLPVVEAMIAGAPVLTSNTTSLAEIAREAALLVDPYDSEAMANAIHRLDMDADLRAELSSRGRKNAQRFDKESYQRALASLYQKFIPADRQSPRTTRSSSSR
ncbi:MAG: glycosyltransferase family 1 protein [Hyphomicrobium aestuarii]|nr:glycosyltransferase family 1 protein [Hyphomicrobium aestuarii]